MEESLGGIIEEELFFKKRRMETSIEVELFQEEENDSIYWRSTSLKEKDNGAPTKEFNDKHNGLQS